MLLYQLNYWLNKTIKTLNCIATRSKKFSQLVQATPTLVMVTIASPTQLKISRMISPPWVFSDSMEADLPNGDVVLIKQPTNFEDGQIYAVEFNNQTYVKKVYCHQTYLGLVSINEAYDDIFAPFEESPRIIGRIAGHFTPVEI